MTVEASLIFRYFVKIHGIVDRFEIFIDTEMFVVEIIIFIYHFSYTTL